LPLPPGQPPAAFIPEARARHRLDPLPIDEADAFELARLPPLHQNPFDRMLICQTIARQAVIVTPDPLIRQYSVGVRWLPPEYGLILLFSSLSRPGTWRYARQLHPSTISNLPSPELP